jgi:hypothetical protein
VTESPDPALQFERAEFAPEARTEASCAFCSKPIHEAYYTLNGSVACDRCRQAAEAQRAAGSRLARVLRATLYGSIAGMLGAALWYGVRALTGWEVGLISIVVGVMVGQAVLKGSNGRGGRGYQILAVALTYGSIVSTYVPMITKEIFSKVQQESATPASAAPADPASKPVQAAPAPAAPAPAVAASVTEAPPSAGKMALALIVFAALICAVAVVAPFLGGFENAIGILIIAFGVWEAWKINRKTELVVTGPHRLVVAAADVA